MSINVNYGSCFFKETEETEVITTEETRTTETTTTTTTTIGVVEEEASITLVEEKHTTRLEVAPTFTKPLLPATTADEGETVRWVILYSHKTITFLANCSVHIN